MGGGIGVAERSGVRGNCDQDGLHERRIFSIKINKEKLLEIEPFYLNFCDSDDNFNINYTIDYYIGEGMTCS